LTRVKVEGVTGSERRPLNYHGSNNPLFGPNVLRNSTLKGRYWGIADKAGLWRALDMTRMTHLRHRLWAAAMVLNKVEMLCAN
jgi:hypothetical protein